jgi:hypothetical protein
MRDVYIVSITCANSVRQRATYLEGRDASSRRTIQIAKMNEIQALCPVHGAARVTDQLSMNDFAAILCPVGCFRVEDHGVLCSGVEPRPDATCNGSIPFSSLVQSHAFEMAVITTVDCDRPSTWVIFVARGRSLPRCDIGHNSIHSKRFRLGRPGWNRGSSTV